MRFEIVHKSFIYMLSISKEQESNNFTFYSSQTLAGIGFLKTKWSFYFSFVPKHESFGF